MLICTVGMHIRHVIPDTIVCGKSNCCYDTGMCTDVVCTFGLHQSRRSESYMPPDKMSRDTTIAGQML